MELASMVPSSTWIWDVKDVTGFLSSNEQFSFLQMVFPWLPHKDSKQIPLIKMQIP